MLRSAARAAVSAAIVMAAATAPADRTRVTRDVEPPALVELLEHPPRATVAFVDRGRVEILPVRYRLTEGVHVIGLPADAPDDVQNRAVVLVIDDGEYWFELRGVSVRGVAQRIDINDRGESSACAWYAIVPQRVLAWDYDAIRKA